MILFKKWARNKVKSHIYVRPSFISLFATLTIEHKNSCGTKVLYLNCKTLFIIILLKSFMANFFFLRYCKDIASFSFWVLCECLIMSINNDSITLQENMMSKVLKSTCRKLWCLSTYKKSTSSQTSFWDIVKTLQTCYFSNLGNAWSSPSKIIVSICRKLSCSSACKISTSSLTFFLR